MLTFDKTEMLLTTGPWTHFKLALTSDRQRPSKFAPPYFENILFSTKMVVDQSSFSRFLFAAVLFQTVTRHFPGCAKECRESGYDPPSVY